MFGATQETVLSEESPFNPVSPYGVSKVSAFYICKYFREAHGLKIVTAISFNHESPFRHELFVTRKLSIAAARGVFPESFGNLNAIRDWGHVLDFCRAFHLMVLNP
jgi:GDPmannose 4,6-dehydratase